MTTTTRTVEQVEHDLETLRPVGAPPATGASDEEHLAYYRQMLVRDERERALWRELFEVLPSGAPQWAVQAVLRAEAGCIEHATEVRGWIREDERRTRV